MIWFTIALFVISFLATAFLTPKPKLEDARPQNLKDVNFPRATENAPIPLVLGKVLMDAPNTIWWGDFDTEPVYENIKTGIFSSKNVIVAHNYFLGFDLALALGPGTTISEVQVDDKVVWSGSTADDAPTVLNFTSYNLFGGYKEGGGFSGTARYYPGSLDILEQPVNAYVEDIVGSGNVPAYLGTSHIVFERVNIGESAQLRKIAFVMENYSNDLGLSNNGMIGEDMNPAEAIYQIMTDDWRGMGIASSNIDLVALSAVGETLYAEGNGCSIVVTAEGDGRNLIQEILRQIDGISYQDSETGKIVFKLIREDYTVSLLDVYDENDIIEISDFSRTGWEEVVSQVKVSFPKRESNESQAVAISQDMATVNMIGRLKSSTISMPFVYNRDLANVIASRERAQLSIPLFRMTIVFNRNANLLRPGSVFKLNWDEYNFQEIVMRVQEFDFGELVKGRIVAKCLQDQFAVNTVVFASPTATSWVAPTVSPQTIANKLIVEMPRFFQNKLENPIPDGYAGVIPIARVPSSVSSSYDMAAGTVSGDLSTREPKYAGYPPTGLLTAQYDDTDGFTTGLDATGFTIDNVDGVFVKADDEADMRGGERGLLYVDGEWMAFYGLTDNMDGSYDIFNIRRGLFGSRPKTHADNTRVYQIFPELFGEGTLDDLLADGTLYYKLIDRVGPFSQYIGNITESSQVMTDIADRPVRPRNLQINSSRTLPISIDNSTNMTLSWVASNRNATDAAFENDAAETPAETETYTVKVYDDGVEVGSLGTTGTSSGYVVMSAGEGRTGAGEIRVWADRDSDSKQSNDYAFIPFTWAQV